MGYEIGIEFQVKFDDDSKAECLALVPPEDRPTNTAKWTHYGLVNVPISMRDKGKRHDSTESAQFHTPPEIFVSDGPDGSIVGDWVNERGGVGGVHHIAYQVSDVEATMSKWKENGYAEFLSDKPMECPGLKQVFTKPSELTGIIYELISREGKGFCEANVKGLMESTKGR